MQNCSVCGEKTRLFVSRVPLCVACYEAGPEHREARSLLKVRERDELVMPTPVANDVAVSLGRLVPQGQKALVTFLQADLELSSTLLETAELSLSRRHAEAALERVRRALQSIRSLGARINDPVAQADICNRANGLELRLETFPL